MVPPQSCEGRGYMNGIGSSQGPRPVSALWWVALTLVLGLVYSSAILRSNTVPIWAGNYPTLAVNSHPHFDRVSEVLVMNPIDAAVAGVPIEKDFLFHVQSDPRVLDVNHLDRYQPEWIPSADLLSKPDYYRTQIGVQGWVYVEVTKALGVGRDTAFAIFWTLNAFFLAAVLAIFIRFIYIIWGREAAIAAAAFSALSTGLNVFSWSMFWLAFLDIAPAAAATFLALRLPVRSWVRTLPSFLGLLALFLLTFANGYEAMTVTISSVAVPFVIVFAAGRIPFKTMIGYASAAVALGVASFAAALAAHHFLYMNAFGGSGIDWVFSRTEHWGPESPYAPSLVGLGKILVVNAVDIARVGLPVLLLVLLAAPFVFKAARSLLTLRRDDESDRIALAVTAALMSSASWPLVQFAHVAFHSRYMSLVMAFPFGLVLMGALGRMWAMRRESRHRSAGSPRITTGAEPAHT
jgi:hypothetical protein